MDNISIVFLSSITWLFKEREQKAEYVVLFVQMQLINSCGSEEVVQEAVWRDWGARSEPCLNCGGPAPAELEMLPHSWWLFMETHMCQL